MRKILLFIAFVLVIQTTKGQEFPVGTQIWTKYNLDLTSFSDGAIIQEVTNPSEWAIFHSNINKSPTSSTKLHSLRWLS